MKFRVRRPHRLISGVLLPTLLVIPASLHGAETLVPEVTAQGFDITEVQNGSIGAFGRLRVRFEAPERIAELRVKERSYEVDLATTPEANHLPLFSLNRQVRQLTDVTLDFEPYINDKIDAPGTYEFDLVVVDRRGNQDSARLTVRVDELAATAITPTADRLDTSTFRLERVGTSAVSGADEFGFRWTTVDSDRVVIRLAPGEHAPCYFFTLPPAAYESLQTRTELLQAAQTGRPLQAVDIVTIANQAAGRVFGVVRNETPLVFKVTESHTSLSDDGTTVRLAGEYKF